MWICMKWTHVGVYKLKPASSIALLFFVLDGKFVSNKKLHDAKISLFFSRWQTEKNWHRLIWNNIY